jgi:hypothetical protein
MDAASFSPLHQPPAPRRGFPRVWHVGALIVAAIGAMVASGLVFGEGPDWGPHPTARFAFIETDPVTGEAVRFDPCSDVRYVVNPVGAPPGAMADLRRSLELISEATGLTFVDEGLTDEVPGFGRRAYQHRRYGRRWAPVLIGWVDRGVEGFRHGGLGIGKATIRESDRGVRAIVSGWVMLNANAALEPGFGPGDTWGEVILHELAHVLGLAHVDDPRQIMYPSVTPGPARLASGDIDGLRWVGDWGDCRKVPPPGRSS